MLMMAMMMTQRMKTLIRIQTVNAHLYLSRKEQTLVQVRLFATCCCCGGGDDGDDAFLFYALFC